MSITFWIITAFCAGFGVRGFCEKYEEDDDDE